jgi:hypothetical protein
MDARITGCDRTKITADFGRSIGFGIKRFKMSGAAIHPNQNTTFSRLSTRAIDCRNSLMA